MAQINYATGTRSLLILTIRSISRCHPAFPL